MYYFGLRIMRYIFISKLLIMKNFTAFVFAVLLSGSLYAQEDLDNQFYIRLGIARPFWSTYGALGQDAWLAGTQRKGGLLELGYIYMLNKLPLADGLRLGVNVDWFAFEYHGFVYEDDITIDVGILSKIGPSISYSPLDKLVFDVYGKVVVTWISAVGFVYNGEDLEEEDTYSKTGGITYTFGVNIRYAKLILGFAVNTGALQLTNSSGEILGAYYGNQNSFTSGSFQNRGGYGYPNYSSYQNGSVPGNGKTPLPSMSFTVGMSF
jgi:hypothetical protein